MLRKIFQISLFFWFLVFYDIKGQTIVGMGTDSPNPNAVLELVSENQNQGFLVPRLSTQQRNASSFTSRLTNQDNGLMVFDTDEGNFYYWYEGMWRIGSGTTNSTPKGTFWYVGDVMPNNNQGEDGDFYIHQPTSDLYRKQNSTFTLIGSLKKIENSYSAGNGISITDQNQIINTGDLDTTNELQDLYLSGTTLGLSGSTTTIDLSSLDTDNQILSLSGNALSIANGNTIDLSSINTDAQDLTLSGNIFSLTGDATQVNLSATTPSNGQVLKWNTAQSRWEAQSDANTVYTAGSGITINGNNEIVNAAPDQTVSFTGSGAVSVTGTYPTFTISATDNVNDADADPANELQDLSMVLSRGASAGNQKISNLAAPVNAADAATKTYVDGLHALDADQSSTNEIQDLSLSGNSLKITNNASATTIDLSPYLDNTDAQTLTLSGSTLSITGGNTIDLSSLNTDSQILSLSGNTLNITNGNAVDLSNINTDEQELSLSGTTLGLSGSSTTIDLSVLQDGTGTDSQSLSSSKTATDVTLTISGGNTTTFSVADNDDDANNEKITSASLTAGDILRIQEAGTNHDVDLSGFQKKALPANQILVGNASSVATPVSISGDVTLNSDGTMTITLDAVTTAKIINNAITTAKIADDAVTKDKINADVAGNGLGQNTNGSLEVNVVGGGLQITTDQLQLTNKSDGQILIGDGTQVNSRTVSGDANLANTGAAKVTGLQGRPVSTTAPTNNQILCWDGSAWTPKTSTGAVTGASFWFSGNSVPTTSNPPGASTGDYYFHTGTKMVYRKDGSWAELGKWVMPSGSTITGTTITSTSTPTLYIGTGSPTGGTTNNAQPGDFYFDTSDGATGRLYIKKNNNDWQNF